MTLPELRAAIERASSVRITRIGGFDPRNRGRGETLAMETDPDAMQLLRNALAIDESSLAQEMRWMTPGNVEIHFLDGHMCLASVTYLAPSCVRWPSSFDARLRAPELLSEWLAARGVVLPSRSS